MATIFVSSDPHFGHASTFTKFLVNGVPMRPFSSVEEMNEHMVQAWNDVVRPKDKAYILGDIAMADEYIDVVGRLNGQLRLILGNHDNKPITRYAKYFEKILSSRRLDKLLLTHIPVHPDSIPPDHTNVHGHVHNNVSPLHYGPRYFNVSVEMTNYRPLTLEELRERIARQWDEWLSRPENVLTRDWFVRPIAPHTSEAPFNAVMAGLKL